MRLSAADEARLVEEGLSLPDIHHPFFPFFPFPCHHIIQVERESMMRLIGVCTVEPSRRGSELVSFSPVPSPGIGKPVSPVVDEDGGRR